MSYEIGDLIGTGGSSDVYEAYRDVFGERVAFAVKVLREDAARDGDVLRCFEAEARHGLELSGGCAELVTTHDAIVVEGKPAIVLKLCRSSLAALLSGSVVPYATLRDAARAALVALAYLHERGWVHRDLKPENLLIAADGAIRLGDLGLLTRARERCPWAGTAAYAHPDALREGRADPSWDLWSLGSTLYHCATGRPPFGTGAHAELIARIDGPSPVLPDHVPTDLRDLVAVLLQREPWSAREALTLLEVGEGRAGTIEAAHAAHAAHGVEERRRGRGAPWIGAVLIAALLGAGAAWRVREPVRSMPAHEFVTREIPTVTAPVEPDPQPLPAPPRAPDMVTTVGHGDRR